MHVSLDIDVSPSGSMPTGRWFVIRAGVREADPRAPSSLSQEPTENAQRGPRKTFWFFTRLLSRERNEHLDHRSYTMRVPRTATESGDLSSILLVDLLVQGVYPDDKTSKHGNRSVNDHSVATDIPAISYERFSDRHTINSDTVLLGRYRISLMDLLGSRGQSQVVSIASLIEDRKLADLTVQYQLFINTGMDKYITVSIDRLGARGYLSLCAYTAAADHSSYDVVYQDTTGGAKTGPTFELSIPYDIIMCHASSYGLAIADKGETGIPASDVIDRKELKKAGLDLLMGFHDSQASIPLSSTNSLSTSTRQKQSAISLKYIDKQSKIDQPLYVVIDDSIQMRFECLKAGAQVGARMLLQTIFEKVSQLISDADVGSSEQKSPLLATLWRDVLVSGVKWSAKEVADAIQSYVLNSNAVVRGSGLSERPFGRSSYELVISKGIYVLALSNSTVYAPSLHTCISECSSTAFLLFCFMDSNPEISKLLAQYSNVAVFDIIAPDYDQLHHTLLSICSCIRYSTKGEKKRQCICGYHIK